MPPLNKDLVVEGCLLSQHLDNVSSPTGSCASLGDLNGMHGDKFEHPPRCHRSKKVVSFQTNPLQQVHYVKPSSYWTNDERLCKWHSHDDYIIFRQDVFHSLYLLRNHPESFDEKSHTARGIECRHPTTVTRRQSVKQQAWRVVFEAQEALRLELPRDQPESFDWMASKYSNAARPALQEALQFAVLDEIQAKDIYREGVPPAENSTWKQLDDDGFSDDWIRSISSLNDDINVAASKKSEKQGGLSVLGAQSGFDDSWIRGGFV